MNTALERAASLETLVTRKSSIASHILASTLTVSLVLTGCGGSDKSNERWVTTQNTKVDIDWDAIGKAYKEAEGPKDLEKRINEIYTGDEIISVSVLDVDAKTQKVTGFIDANTNGKSEKDEEIFVITRDLKGDDSASYQVRGYGPYSGYHSPMWSLASGMMMGAMLSSAFSPGYRPMYTRPYTTPASRRSTLASQRSSYRKANPSKFSGASSKSGSKYGRKGGAFGGGKSVPSRTAAPSRSGGGGRFGIAAGRSKKTVHLS